MNLPDYEDFADVEKLNENFEIIDAQMKSTEDALTTHLDNSLKLVTTIQTQSQSVLHNDESDVLWDSINPANNADFADLQNNKIRLKKGLYVVIARVAFAPNGNGGRELIIDNKRSQSTPTATGDCWILNTAIVNATHDDFLLACKVLQTSGAALTLYGSGYNSMQIIRLGVYT